METFEVTVREIVAPGAEIGLHGYANEGAYQMTLAQERDVPTKCIDVCTWLPGPDVPTLQDDNCSASQYGFLYDLLLGHHDSQPYFAPDYLPVKPVDFFQPASRWLKPSTVSAMDDTPPAGLYPLVEIPAGWNSEDMIALQYFPHLHNSHGHVDAWVMEQRWKDMFLWLWENTGREGVRDGSFVFPILMHPDTNGIAHVIGMVDRFVGWLWEWGESVELRRLRELRGSFCRG